RRGLSHHVENNSRQVPDIRPYYSVHLVKRQLWVFLKVPQYLGCAVQGDFSFHCSSIWIVTNRSIPPAVVMSTAVNFGRMKPANCTRALTLSLGSMLSRSF